MLSEPKARERKTILEWLQRNASTGPDIDDVVKELQHSAERGEILAHGWLHTRGAIKQHKRLVASSNALEPNSIDLAGSILQEKRKLVTQLDPDVVRRQGDRQLAPQDSFFEQSIWLGCYELLRRGSSMADIRDWCLERTELWRAATFSSLPLSERDDEDVPYFDAFSTVLWRRMCFQLSQTSPDDDKYKYERAVYGILSGDVSAVDAVCKTWDDFMFAKYNGELRAQFDRYLAKQCDADAIRSLKLLYGDVISHIDSRDRDERGEKAGANTPSKALQAAIIDDKLDNLLYQQGFRIAEQANQREASRLMPYPVANTAPRDQNEAKYFDGNNYDAIRVLAHVYIIISALDKLEGKDTSALGPLALKHEVEEHVVAAYTTMLRISRLEQLIPLYASRLLGERRYTNLSRNLIHVQSRDGQLKMLSYMQKLGLDVVKFVKTQPQLFLTEGGSAISIAPPGLSFRILQDGPPALKYGRFINPGIFGTGSDESDGLVLGDKKDEFLIRSMEWLLLVDGLVLETCDFGVEIYKYFLSEQFRLLLVPILLTYASF